MSSDDRGHDKCAVIILEDDKSVQDGLASEIRRNTKMLERRVSVCACSTIDDAWKEVGKLERDNYIPAVFLVDQVRQADDFREWGIQFLREVRNKYPNAYRILFSCQSDRKEIQGVLDESLVHHFEVKGPESTQKLVDRIISMLQGNNEGNVQSPTAKDEFRKFMSNWIETLPDGLETNIHTLGGKMIRAGALMDDLEALESFRKAYETARMDRFVRGSGK